MEGRREGRREGWREGEEERGGNGRKEGRRVRGWIDLPTMKPTVTSSGSRVKEQDFANISPLLQMKVVRGNGELLKFSVDKTTPYITYGACYSWQLANRGYCVSGTHFQTM